MPKIKICGIRRIEDVSYLNKYLPEYAGFIFAQSRRRVTCSQAKELGNTLDVRIKKVGVFVNEEQDTVVATTVECGLDAVQIHGDEGPDYVSKLKEKLHSGLNFGRNKEILVWKAIRIKDISSISEMKEYEADAFVLDAYVEGAYGGTGKAFDWELAKEAGKHGKVILAGGLDTYNAWKAIGVLQPFALDISSGVETEGYKDGHKIREFINTVRSYG